MIRSSNSPRGFQGRNRLGFFRPSLGQIVTAKSTRPTGPTPLFFKSSNTAPFLQAFRTVLARLAPAACPYRAFCIRGSCPKRVIPDKRPGPRWTALTWRFEPARPWRSSAAPAAARARCCGWMVWTCGNSRRPLCAAASGSYRKKPFCSALPDLFPRGARSSVPPQDSACGEQDTAGLSWLKLVRCPPTS